MMKKTFTHKELARLLSVSETTIKSYRRKFDACIPVANLGKPIRFTESALQVCQQIRDHFNAGMSVEEVRARLAQQFSWIAPQCPEKDDAAPQTMALPQDFTQSVSNLAKSMVTLTQQQGTMLKRMQEIESALSRSGTHVGPAQQREESPQPAALAQPTGSVLEETLNNAVSRLERLDAVTEMLQSAVAGLAGAMAAFQPFAQTQDQTATSTQTGQESEGAKIYRFPSPGQQEQREQAECQMAQDPPRHLLGLPLVVRTAQGGYIGAGGRSRGRFTLNDLKALLAYGRNAAEQYAMRWECAQDGSWWLILEQAQSESQRQLRMQLQELSTQRGITVAEVTQLVDGDRSVHPAELCAFVAGLSGEL